jgi:rubrerythrin
MNKTLENLKAAFVGESQARNKYTFFAQVAKKEGYHYIAKILEETAENERRHAKDELALLNGIGNTVANLKEAIGGEDYETREMYPTFAREAEAEGNQAAALLFKEIGEVEEHHRERFKALLALVESGMVYKREKPIKWKCSVCGYIHEGTEPPTKCPCCQHPKVYFEPANLDF